MRRVLTFEAVTRHYGRVRALDNVSFSLAPGTLTVLLGANGAGKSTLLRLAATLDKPTRGRVSHEGIGDDDVKARAQVGYLGQEPGLYDELTVRENLMFTARFHGKTYAVEQAAGLCGIGRKLDDRARTLSRGERQRAALARALCAGELLLLDEPTTALDITGRSQVADMLADLHGARTTLIATHDEHVLDLADRVLVLDGGLLVIDGTSAEGRAWLEARV